MLVLASVFPVFSLARTLLGRLLRNPSSHLLSSILTRLPPPVPGVRLELGPVNYAWPLGSPFPEDQALAHTLCLGLSPHVLVRVWTALLLQTKVRLRGWG